MYLPAFLSHVLAHGAIATQPPSCGVAIDSLSSRVRQNYAGFILEVNGARAREHARMLGALRSRASKVPFNSCLPVLEAYTAWFADPHLFIFQNVSGDSAGNRARQAAIELRPTTDSAVRTSLARRRPDPIEGVWFDEGMRIAVVRDTARRGPFFVGVLLASDTSAWPIGAVRARFERLRNGHYRAEVQSREFGLRVTTAHLHKGVMLRLDPGIWGKAWPVRSTDEGLIDTVDVHRPTILVRSKSVVVSIPSHDFSQGRRLQALLRQHQEDIKRTGLLIVDLRGNEGGASPMSNALHPWITTATRRPTPFDSGEAVMLSSPPQIRYASRSFGPDTSQFVRSLVARLTAHPGALVPLSEGPARTPPDSVLDGEWQVVMMVDRGTVSASEVLVLRGLRSTRTRVVGQPTAGALDYQSVSIIGLGLDDRRWALGYPTIAAHAELPRRGMRGKGIQPHVSVDWDRLADPIGEIERQFWRP